MPHESPYSIRVQQSRQLSRPSPMADPVQRHHSMQNITSTRPAPLSCMTDKPAADAIARPSSPTLWMGAKLSGWKLRIFRPHPRASSFRDSAPLSTRGRQRPLSCGGRAAPCALCLFRVPGTPCTGSWPPRLRTARRHRRRALPAAYLASRRSPPPLPGPCPRANAMPTQRPLLRAARRGSRGVKSRR